MLIDWFTIIAQIINFLILVYLLKYLLYGPIIRAMDQREASIQSRFDEAQQRLDEAEEGKKFYMQKQAEIDDEKDTMLARAKEEAALRRTELIKKARDEVDGLRAKWHEGIRHEKEGFLLRLRGRAAEQLLTIAKRALKDLSNEEIERSIIDVFIKRIKELDEGDKRKIIESIRGSSDSITITSAFKLPDEARTRVIEIVKEQLEWDGEINFTTSPELIAGIELRAQGHKIAWSLESYLESLEETLSEDVLKEVGDSPEPKPATGESKRE